MTRRGPRGDLSREAILAAADNLVVEHGDVAKVSLRGVAARLGVTANALYTYVPSLAAMLHDLADERLGLLRVHELVPPTMTAPTCSHCALVELYHRATALYASPGTLALLKAQPVLGPHSFSLSESVMFLCTGAALPARDAHDLIMGWFYGSASLAAEGWTSGTDAIRTAPPEWAEEFPLIAGRTDADRDAQFAAILHGIGLVHTGTGAA